MNCKNYFGIDKATIGGFEIMSIDNEKLSKIKNVTSFNDKYLYFVSNGIYSEFDFSYINIKKTPHFKSFTAGIKKVGHKNISYVYIEVTNDDDKPEKNLYPLTTEEFSRKIDSIITFLSENYGIELIKTEFKFKDIEISLNLTLKEKFDSYYPVFDTMLNLFPKSYKNKNIHKDGTSTTGTFKAQNSRLSISIYNKKKQMLDTHNYLLHSELARFEYTLKNSKKIKEIFSTDKIDDITDEMLKNFFKKQLEKDFFKNYTNHIKKMKKTLSSHMKDILNKKNWKKELIQYLLELLDTFSCQGKILTFDFKILEIDIRKKDPKNYLRNLRDLKSKVPMIFRDVDIKIEEIHSSIKAL